jgi:hypothetical protein
VFRVQAESSFRLFASQSREDQLRLDAVNRPIEDEHRQQQQHQHRVLAASASRVKRVQARVDVILPPMPASHSALLVSLSNGLGFTVTSLEAQATMYPLSNPTMYPLSNPLEAQAASLPMAGLAGGLRLHRASVQPSVFTLSLTSSVSVPMCEEEASGAAAAGS